MTRERLKEIMDFIFKEYPDGCLVSNYKDKDQTPEDFEIPDYVEQCLNEFLYEDLGTCGCGTPDDTIKVLQIVLTSHSVDHNRIDWWEAKSKMLNDICGIDRNKNSNYNGLIQFVQYILDDHKFMEHGSSIGGAWLTEKGKIFLEIINEYFSEEKEEE